MQTVICVLAFVIGACLGSFLCCQARRLHYRTRHPHSKLNRRSICLHCRKQLAWYDNIPLISWVILRGKCRHCHQPIGVAELLSEFGVGAALVGISVSFYHLACGAFGSTIFGLFPPQNLTITTCSVGVLNYIILITIILLTLLLSFLAIYDGLYGELPSLGLILAIVFGLSIVILRICASLALAPFSPSLLLDPLLAVVIFGGLYLLLYLLSKGRWVGDGDWLLATAIALALGTPWLALLALFLANFLATIIMLPTIKGNRTHRIHFGPFMVIAFVITCTFSSFFITFML